MNILVFTYPLSAVLIFILALGLGILLTRKFNLGWHLYWIGAGTFILSQVGHIPFNWLLTQLFKQGVLPSPPLDWKLPFNAAVLGLSAGLWEEMARYGMYRWWAKDARSWSKGLLLGAGHGGIEAIIVAVVILWTYIQMLALRNVDLSTVFPPAQLDLAEMQVSSYWSSPWAASLLGFVERLFSVPSHIAFSVIVLQTFIRQQKRWLWLAVALHAFTDAVAVYLSGIWRAAPWGMYALEGILGIIALVSLGIIFALRQPEAPEPLESLSLTPSSPVILARLQEIDETPENLEKTRYN